MAILGVADEVHCHVLDDGHILGSESGSEPCEVVVEDDIENPMEPVFDAPVVADGLGEGLGVEFCRGYVVASFRLNLATALGGGLDHADHGQSGEFAFVGKAAVGEEPIDLMADAMVALLQTAVIGIDGVVVKNQ